MIIIGMGKLGGDELNFSSDIDLIFTYPEQGETYGGRKPVENQQFFTRLGQQLISALHHMPERLRPLHLPEDSHPQEQQDFMQAEK